VANRENENGDLFSEPPIRLDDEERIARLQLIRTDQVGPALFRDLLDHCGSAGNALAALPDLSRRGGARRPLRICPRSEAETELDKAASFGARYVAVGEHDYPRHLATLDAPPPLLAVKGAGAIFRRDAVAIVGARNCSMSGSRFAGRMAEQLGSAGYAIASGLARGIDAAAHNAALETGTVAVFAGGLDRVYPPEHKRLVDEILDHDGAVITEMSFGLSPRGRDFPRRNRIVSGMSLGVVVIEAAQRSGTLHTARFALEQNREIFAVPGPPLDPRSQGCNRLIRQGAHLITEIRHITDVLAPIADRRSREPGSSPIAIPRRPDTPGPEANAPAQPDRDRVLTALGKAPVSVDDLVRHTELPARTVQFILLELELANRIERHGNQTVSLQY